MARHCCPALPVVESEDQRVVISVEVVRQAESSPYNRADRTTSPR